MDNTTSTPPVLIELDADTWNRQLDQAKKWLDNVVLVQASYRQLLEDTAAKIDEPHIRQYLLEIAGRAKDHEAQVWELYAAIDREPAEIRKTLGALAGKGRQVLGDLLALTGGAKGPWQDLHQCFMANYNAMGAFAVVEQLGLALGIPGLSDLAFDIVAQKSTDQLILQEFVLEMCAKSILYREWF
jgi:hypothetical protein